MAPGSQTTRVLIVDDEPPARQRIADLLRRDPDMGPLFEAGNGEAAVRMIREEQPDLVLLDVQMPGLNGLEVIRAVGPQRMPLTVFVTAYNRHAIDAFDANALDYLLKPYSDERFETMLARFKLQRQNSHLIAFGQKMMAMVPAAPAPRHLDRLAIKGDGVIRFVRVQDMVWIEASDVYVTLHLASERILHRTALNELERTLDPARFVRIHRAVIVNIDCIVQLTVRSHGEFDALMQGGATLRVSRTYRPALEARLQQKL